MTTTWLGSGRGICSPLVAFPGTPRGSESPSPCLPGCGSATRLSVLAPVSASSPWVLRGAPPFPSDSISPRQLGARPLPAAALTSGTRKPLRVFLCVQPKGRASPSSYSAGSQRASALLAAPSAGLLLKWQGWPSASAGQLLGLLVRTPQGIPPGKDGSLCPRETGCGGGASEVCGGLDHSHPRRLGAPPPQGKALLPAVYIRWSLQTSWESEAGGFQQNGFQRALARDGEAMGVLPLVLKGPSPWLGRAGQVGQPAHYTPPRPLTCYYSLPSWCDKGCFHHISPEERGLRSPPPRRVQSGPG